MIERRFHLLLDGVLEAPNIAVGMNFDRKYASRIVAENPTIQQKQGSRRTRSTDYFKSRRVTEKKVSVLTDRRGLDNDMECLFI